MRDRNIKDKLEEEKKVLEGDKSKNKIYSSTNSFEHEQQAGKALEKAKEKLFNVNLWSDVHALSSEFEMFSSDGAKKPSGKPNQGDFIKISLPGPLPENWVVITKVKEEKDAAYFTVSPSKNPTSVKQETEHFFIKEAQSTFRMERNGNDVSAFEIGTNEGINNHGEESGSRSLINILIAEGGWAGFQKFQWEKLTDYLVHKTEINS